MMRYKTGDVVIYIDTPNNPIYLTYGKSYVISHTAKAFYGNDAGYIIWIINDIGTLDYLSSDKFISVEEYRDSVISDILA